MYITFHFILFTAIERLLYIKKTNSAEKKDTKRAEWQDNDGLA